MHAHLVVSMCVRTGSREDRLMGLLGETFTLNICDAKVPEQVTQIFHRGLCGCW